MRLSVTTSLLLLTVISLIVLNLHTNRDEGTDGTALEGRVVNALADPRVPNVSYIEIAASNRTAASYDEEDGVSQEEEHDEGELPRVGPEEEQSGRFVRYDTMSRSELHAELKILREALADVRAMEVERYVLTGIADPVSKESAWMEGGPTDNSIPVMYYDAARDQYYRMHLNREHSPDLFLLHDDAAHVYHRIFGERRRRE